MPKPAATVFVSAGEFEADEYARQDALHIVATNAMLKERVQAMIDFFDENGWPGTANLAPQFTDRQRSRNYPNLKIACQIMPAETHVSSPPGILSRGLRYVFGHWAP